MEGGRGKHIMATCCMLTISWFLLPFECFFTLNMSACLVGGCAGESTGACVVNSLEKFPTSSSLLM